MDVRRLLREAILAADNEELTLGDRNDLSG